MSEDATSAKGNHILFVGFMGSGKTTVSKALAARTGLALVDTDQRIEQVQGRAIKEIFAEAGEEGFRKIETETLRGLAGLERSVVSCGGGVVCNPVNRPILSGLGTVVYLQISLEGCLARIPDTSTRPLLNGARPVQDIYCEQMPWYEQVADITINVEEGSKDEIAEAVYASLAKRGEL